MRDKFVYNPEMFSSYNLTLMTLPFSSQNFKNITFPSHMIEGVSGYFLFLGWFHYLKNKLCLSEKIN